MADYSLLWQGAQPRSNGTQNMLAAQQYRANNQLMQEHQAEQQRTQQFNTLLGEFLGQGPMNTLGAPGAPPGGGAMQYQMPDGSQMPARAPVSMNQLYALDPQRAMQVQQFQQTQAQLAAQQQQAQAMSAVRKAQFVIDSKNPGALVKAAYPEIWQQMIDLGDDPEAYTPEKWKEEAQQMLAYYAPLAGVSPAGDGEQFTLSQGQTRFDAQGRPIASVDPAPTDKDPNDKQFQRAGAYRKEYLSRVDGFEGIRSAYENVKAATDSDAGDTQLMTNFLRVIAPGVRVQPGQQLDAAQLPSGMQTAAALWNKFVNDGKLNPKDRASIREQAKITFDTQKKIAAAERERYTKLAKLSGIDPWEVVGDGESEGDPAGTDFSQMSDEELRRIAAGG